MLRTTTLATCASRIASWKQRRMAFGEICLGSPMAFAMTWNGFARAELLRKPPVSEGKRSSLRSISRVTSCLSTCQRRTDIANSGGSSRRAKTVRPRQSRPPRTKLSCVSLDNELIEEDADGVCSRLSCRPSTFRS
jgi:hypothetical protein